MAKTIKKHVPIKPPENTVQEPAVLYAPSVKIIPSVTDFSFKKFQKIADKVPFTQKEWANILHLSERTLQRYSKDNSSFEGIYIDRILQIEQLINLGLETFNNAASLYDWLKKDKVVFNRVLNFESLYSYQGIQDTYNQIGRILHNVYT
ncbi:MAG: hypothetical protein KGL19_14030 [Bacteroidota bacterium]|nr:hypothetical protein [Bacteroidota bacterium]